jgi:putative lipoic acid-binding regulatory protein
LQDRRKQMLFMNKGAQKPVMEYPCPWIYKIIGGNQEELKAAAAQVMRDRAYTVSLSSCSAKGKYHCLNVQVLVPSEAVRLALYESLRSHPSVMLVL